MTSAAVHKFAGSGPRSRGMDCCGKNFIRFDGYFGMIGGLLWMNMILVLVVMDYVRTIRILGIGRGRVSLFFL